MRVGGCVITATITGFDLAKGSHQMADEIKSIQKINSKFIYTVKNSIQLEIKLIIVNLHGECVITATMTGFDLAKGTLQMAISLVRFN
jgi:hypothetical protein